MPRAQQQAKIIFRGSVQGVGFRWKAKKLASAAGLAGWVRNCSDSSVEVVIQGPREDILGFILGLQEAMSGYILQTTVDWQNQDRAFDGFEIRF